MGYTQQFEQDSAMGCVCDFDVACPSHRDGRWVEPRLTGDCREFGHLFQWYTETAGKVETFDVNECVSCGGARYFARFDSGEGGPTGDARPKARKVSSRQAFIADYRLETGATRAQAALAWEDAVGQEASFTYAGSL